MSLIASTHDIRTIRAASIILSMRQKMGCKKNAPSPRTSCLSVLGLLLCLLSVVGAQPTENTSVPHQKERLGVRRLLSSRSPVAHQQRQLSLQGCKKGQFYMPWDVFTGRDSDTRKWFFYGYYKRWYPHACSGCMHKSWAYTGHKWHNHNSRWPSDAHLWPSFEFDAHEYFTNAGQ